MRTSTPSIFTLPLFLFGLLFSAASLSAKEPLKVYILAGQSNMEGHGHVRVMDYMGEDPKTAPLLKEMKKPDGSHRMIKDVWISLQTGISGRIDGDNREIHGQLTAGYGSQGGRNYDKPGEKIGPELAFGITMQKALKEPILIIKTAWGGQSLHTDFRSPSSGPYVPTEENRERYEAKKNKRETSARYHQMVDHVHNVLKDIKRVYPEYDSEQGYELAGFAWFQGFNDMVARDTYPNRDKPGGYAKYSEWMANFIRDVRKDLKAPDMPFVIGVMGVGGALESMEERQRPTQDNFRKAMSAPAAMPEFKGNVVAVPTAPYWDDDLAVIDKKRQDIRQKAYLLNKKIKNHENADGKMTPDDIKKFLANYEKELFTEKDYALETRAKSNAGYHYLGSVKTYSLIGKAFAEAILKLESAQ